MAKKNFDMSNLDKVDNMPVGGLSGIMGKKPQIVSNEKAGDIDSPISLKQSIEEGEVIPSELPHEIQAKEVKTPGKRLSSITEGIVIPSELPHEIQVEKVRNSVLKPDESNPIILPLNKERDSTTVRIPQNKMTYIKAYKIHKFLQGYDNYSLIDALSEAISLLEAQCPIEDLLKLPRP